MIWQTKATIRGVLYKYLNKHIETDTLNTVTNDITEVLYEKLNTQVSELLTKNILNIEDDLENLCHN